MRSSRVELLESCHFLKGSDRPFTSRMVHLRVQRKIQLFMLDPDPDFHCEPTSLCLTTCSLPWQQHTVQILHSSPRSGTSPWPQAIEQTNKKVNISTSYLFHTGPNLSLFPQGNPVLFFWMKDKHSVVSECHPSYFLGGHLYSRRLKAPAV